MFFRWKYDQEYFQSVSAQSIRYLSLAWKGGGCQSREQLLGQLGLAVCQSRELLPVSEVVAKIVPNAKSFLAWLVSISFKLLKGKWSILSHLQLAEAEKLLTMVNGMPTNLTKKSYHLVDPSWPDHIVCHFKLCPGFEAIRLIT